MDERVKFSLEATCSDSSARATTFTTLHGPVTTPTFMPVGTRATVRNQRLDTVKASGAQVMLSNTYHLFMQPGPELIKEFGGLHKFCGWDRAILTDSGGFQVFSLPDACTITEKGASFTSKRESRRVLLTPELSIETQKALGSDIMMVLDQCVPGTADEKLAREAMERTHRWALRSLAARGDSRQALFAIIQGACHEELRCESVAFLTQHPFDGFAIGGLAVGEERSVREDVTALVAGLLPVERPRYLMGVGTPIDLLEAVHRGVDIFDCILPTAFAEQGVAFTWNGKIDFRRGVYRTSKDPLCSNCSCFACQNYSRAYLHHLVKSGEPSAWQLLGEHNIAFYLTLTKEMREAILANTFSSFYRKQRTALGEQDLEHPISPPARNVIPAFRRGRFEILVTKERGRMRDVESREIMHALEDPDEESNILYVEHSRLEARLKEHTGDDALVVWDVGLGAGSNAMAVVRLFEEFSKTHPTPTLHLVSFEQDLDALRLALDHQGLFPALRHPAPNSIVRNPMWRSRDKRLTWSLKEGDFLQKHEEAPLPDIVMYDPFSYKTDVELWDIKLFERLYERCKDREMDLVTYSTSTAVRASLLAVGFYVASGPPVGPKKETTIASTRASYEKTRECRSYLGGRWMERWNASSAQFPKNIPESLIEQLSERIVRHPQF